VYLLSGRVVGARKVLEGGGGGGEGGVTSRGGGSIGAAGRREEERGGRTAPSLQPLNSLEAGVSSGPTNPLHSIISSEAQGPI
jgi:hypothetical protein